MTSCFPQKPHVLYLLQNLICWSQYAPLFFLSPHIFFLNAFSSALFPSTPILTFPLLVLTWPLLSLWPDKALLILLHRMDCVSYARLNISPTKKKRKYTIECFLSKQCLLPSSFHPLSVFGLLEEKVSNRLTFQGAKLIQLQGACLSVAWSFTNISQHFRSGYIIV